MYPSNLKSQSLLCIVTLCLSLVKASPALGLDQVLPVFLYPKVPAWSQKCLFISKQNKAVSALSSLAFYTEIKQPDSCLQTLELCLEDIHQLHTLNWLIKGAILNPRVGSVP